MEQLIWTPDCLGHGFEKATVKHPADYSGPVVSTIVRKHSPQRSNRAILYIHGFSDYFFQSEMANRFVDNGYGFYAVDLRKYGRSHLKGQHFFEVRSLREYFPDIGAAQRAMTADGYEELFLMGHSTGGLTASLYMSDNVKSGFSALVLNSPFLAWNLPFWKASLIPVISAIGHIWPNMPVAQPKDTTYAHTIRLELGGAWTYAPAWKPDQMPDVTAGWVRAIETAQRHLARGAEIEQPTLVLTSACSAHSGDSPDTFRHADGILDVAKIQRAARRLGPNVTIETLQGGLHDLALSEKSVREIFYNKVLNFLGHL